MGSPVVHFEVVGNDAEALQQFYEKAFGWRVEAAGSGYAMVLPGGEGGINGGVGVTLFGKPRATFYVEVPDTETTLQSIESLGGTRVAGPIDVPEGPRVALFADPEGHVVGLIEAGSRRKRPG